MTTRVSFDNERLRAFCEANHIRRLARLERELSKLFGGSAVDLRTAEDLSRYFRAEVLDEAEVQYAQGG